ncbi:MAG: saccharopine dehydrogenase NADP-binding domain-containing protein [Cyanobacteria bacterium J06621_8]
MVERKTKVLIVGGYGSVGRKISLILASEFPGEVVAAGRNYDRAMTLAIECDNKIIPLELDINFIADTDSLLKNIALVIVCVEQKNTKFVRQCIQRGIDYIDISASYQFLAQVEELDAIAKYNNSTVVLSVGLAPGLTNLLASYGKQAHPDVKCVDIFILLGLGEVHGKDAILWTIENFNASFSDVNPNSYSRSGSFVKGKQTVFPQLGTRTAYRFNFPEQFILPATLNLESAASWLCFDSPLITNGISFLKKIGLLNILKVQLIQKLLIAILRNLHFGSDCFIVQADLKNSSGGIYRYSIAGYGEAGATSIVAAETAKRLLQSSFSSGVFHIEQLFQSSELIQAICEQDSRLTLISHGSK